MGDRLWKKRYTKSKNSHRKEYGLSISDLHVVSKRSRSSIPYQKRFITLSALATTVTDPGFISCYSTPGRLNTNSNIDVGGRVN